MLACRPRSSRSRCQIVFTVLTASCLRISSWNGAICVGPADDRLLLADEPLGAGLGGHQPYQLPDGWVALAGGVDQQRELLLGDLGEAAAAGQGDLGAAALGQRGRVGASRGVQQGQPRLGRGAARSGRAGGGRRATAGALLPPGCDQPSCSVRWSAGC
jgi:hypothetical protein